MNNLLKVFSLAVVSLFIFACGIPGRPRSAAQLSSVPPMIEPGDKIDNMVVTTGAEDATPLWAFCQPTMNNDHLIMLACGEVSFSRLAIGHTFGVMDLALEESDGTELTWELYLDGNPIDLDSFGTYSFIQPELTNDPSPIKKGFRSVEGWDVVIENPTPGAHIISGHARSGDKTYTWVVNFTVTGGHGPSTIYVF